MATTARTLCKIRLCDQDIDNKPFVPYDAKYFTLRLLLVTSLRRC